MLDQKAGAEVHPSFGAITDQIDRMNARMNGESICHLLDPITNGIEYVRFNV